MLLNISNKYQSLLTLNAKIIDATQKKLTAKIGIILAYGKFPWSFGRVAFVNNKFSIIYLGPWSPPQLFENKKMCPFLVGSLPFLTLNSQ